MGNLQWRSKIKNVHAGPNLLILAPISQHSNKCEPEEPLNSYHPKIII